MQMYLFFPKTKIDTSFLSLFSGVIFYAMILGRLPFRTPFKDEYQRQRMLDQIQKGLGPFHDREMSGLTPGKKPSVHSWAFSSLISRSQN